MQDIIDEICTPSPTNEKIQHAFNSINHDQFDHLFLRIIYKNSCTLDQIKLMIDLDAKVPADPDLTVDLIKCISNSNIRRYFIDNFFDVEKYICHLTNDTNVICTRCIDLIYINYQPILDFLMQYPIPIILIAKQLVREKSDKYIIDFVIEKILTDNNVDPSQSNDLSQLMNILMQTVNRKLTCDEIRQFINLGADPRFAQDSCFILSCREPSSEIPLFFINECGCDINAQRSAALYEAICHQSDQNIQLLLDLNITVTDDVIGEAYNNQYEKYFPLLIKYGVDIERIAQITLGLNSSKYVNMLHWLMTNGIDFNKLIADTKF